MKGQFITLLACVILSLMTQLYAQDENCNCESASESTQLELVSASLSKN